MSKLYVGILCVCLAGCGQEADGRRATGNSIGKDAVVTVYSGGKAVKTYRTRGHVDYGTGRAYFSERETGKLVEVNGTYTAEVEQP